VVESEVANRKTKPKITVEAVMKPCRKCGKLTSTDRKCLRCVEVICDHCASFNGNDRYCPACFERIKALYKLA
jgi:hypothetical protein